MQDRRHHTRHKTFLGARLEYANGTQTCDCLIRNMTTHGARITLDGLADLPVRVILHIPKAETRFDARIVWRGAEAAGVEFIDRITPRTRLPSLTIDASY